MPEYSQLSDATLTALLSQKNEAAYREIYNRYWSILYLHARNILKSQDDAKDIVQEIFTTLWIKASDLNFEISLSSYLFKATRNKILNQINHKKIATRYQQSLYDFYEEGKLITDEALREKELSRIIEAEIQRLPAKMRKIFELSRKKHLSYQQIAEHLNISEHTVKSQVSNSLKILRVRLELTTIIIFVLLSL